MSLALTLQLQKELIIVHSYSVPSRLPVLTETATRAVSSLATPVSILYSYMIAHAI